MDTQYIQIKAQQHSTKKKLLTYVVVFFLLLVAGSILFLSHLSRVDLDSEVRVSIEEGTSLIQTATLLKEEGIIKSPTLFRIFGQLNNVSVKAGTYSFFQEHHMREVLDRLDRADYGDVYVTVTLPEGITLNEMSAILVSADLENFNQSEFELLTSNQEGYLFPDTYSFLPEVTTGEIVETLTSTFEEKTSKVRNKTGTRSWEEIVIMASIIEKEATGGEDEQKTIAGILWKRFDEGRLLQVDAPFKYVNGEVKATDLRVDGPYNTYTRVGLTPTPIGNPGLSALEAAVDPLSSPYYFYLHDRTGQVHYAVSYNEHLNNINSYLR